MDIPVTEAAALRQFETMQSAFERARQRDPHGVAEASYMIGGHVACIRIVGREFASEALQPFSHLRLDGSAAVDPHLAIDLWDENATGICLRVPVPESHPGWKKLTAISPDGRFIGQQRPNSLSCYNRKAGHILSSVAWGNRLSIYERGKPLDRPLLEWHNDQNIQLIHAGLVSRHGRGVLFVGKSGTGKSTSSLACLFAGFDFLSEDFVGLQMLPNGFFLGHSIYNSVFLKTDHAKRFPCLSPYVMNGMPHEEKVFVILSRIYPDRLARSVPIRVLVLPRVANASKARFWPASKAEGLLALAPSSFLQIPNRGLGTRGLDKIAQLVDRVPCYWLEAGSDLASVAHCVDELLAQVDR